MKAFVMISVRPGGIVDAVRDVDRVEGVREAYMTFGPYDIVAVVEANDLHHLGNILAKGIQPVPGVLETLTCLAVEN